MAPFRISPASAQRMPRSLTGAIPSLTYFGDMLEAGDGDGKIRGSIQDPVCLALLVATDRSLGDSAESLAKIPPLPIRFLDSIDRLINASASHRSALELSRCAALRTRIWHQCRIAWQLAAMSRTTDPDAAWNAAVLASLGFVVLLNEDSASTLSQLEKPSLPCGPLGGKQSVHPHLDAARGFCLSHDLPAWCLAWTTRMSWPGSVAAIDGVNSPLWHTVRIASYLAADGKTTLTGVDAQGFRDSCLALELKDNRPWREGLVQRSMLAFPDFHTMVTDYPDADRRWLRLALGQAQARAQARCDGQNEVWQKERDLAVNALATMQQAFDSLSFERVMGAMAEFTAGAGHEINNPLAIIQGRARQLHRAAETMVRKASQTEFRGHLENMQDQCRRLHAMLRKLMRFARPPQPVPQSVSAQDLIQQLAAVARGMSGDTQFEWDETQTTHLLHACPTDVSLLTEAWRELVLNAVHAAGPNGQIRMTIECEKPKLLIRLINNGPIIATDDRPHLFTPFFSSRQAGRAPGLGLPLAWRLLNTIGAQLSLESAGDSSPVCWLITMAGHYPIPQLACPEVHGQRNAA